MGLEAPETIDAAGRERETGEIVLTIADAWTWEDERAHLLALQDKINAYFRFVESGQVLEEYPDAVGVSVRIDVIWRVAPTAAGLALVGEANKAGAELGVRVTEQVIRGSGADPTGGTSSP